MNDVDLTITYIEGKDDVRIRYYMYWVDGGWSPGEWHYAIAIEKFVPRFVVARRWRKDLIVPASWVAVEFHDFGKWKPFTDAFKMHGDRLARNYKLRVETEDWLQNKKEDN
jgi:hypothetical protein